MKAYRKGVFEQAFDTTNPGSLLRMNQQVLEQLLKSSDKNPDLFMLMETTYWKLL